MTRKLGLVFATALSIALWSQAPVLAKSKPDPIDPAGIARLEADTGGAAEVARSPSTTWRGCRDPTSSSR